MKHLKNKTTTNNFVLHNKAAKLSTDWENKSGHVSDRRSCAHTESRRQPDIFLHVLTTAWTLSNTRFTEGSLHACRLWSHHSERCCSKCDSFFLSTSAVFRLYLLIISRKGFQNHLIAKVVSLLWNSSAVHRYHRLHSLLASTTFYCPSLALPPL